MNPFEVFAVSFFSFLNVFSFLFAGISCDHGTANLFDLHLKALGHSPQSVWRAKKGSGIFFWVPFFPHTSKVPHVVCVCTRRDTTAREKAFGSVAYC